MRGVDRHAHRASFWQSFSLTNHNPTGAHSLPSSILVAIALSAWCDIDTRYTRAWSSESREYSCWHPAGVQLEIGLQFCKGVNMEVHVDTCLLWSQLCATLRPRRGRLVLQPGRGNHCPLVRSTPNASTSYTSEVHTPECPPMLLQRQTEAQMLDKCTEAASQNMGLALMVCLVQPLGRWQPTRSTKHP
jgi:hypothetical protein